MDCAIRRDVGVSTWTPEMALLGDIFAALTGQVHPFAPKPQRDAVSLDRRLLAQRRRRERQLAQLQEGG